MSKMGGDYQMYRIEKRLDEVQDLLSEVLRRLGKLEFKGIVKYGEPNHISNHGKKYVDIELTRKDRWDKLNSTNEVTRDGDGKPLDSLYDYDQNGDSNDNR
jgi:hypothetical protein|tara:strand:- start:326 stop:628 length:303 start_codon:yes stop_codon:yes gene_type:complete